MYLRTLALAAVLTLAVSACGFSDDGAAEEPAEAEQAEEAAGEAESAEPDEEPMTEEAAMAAAVDALGAYSAGDYGAAWERLSAQDQELVSQEDYVRLHEELCTPPDEGVVVNVEDVTLGDDGETATVRVSMMEMATDTYDMVYEDGEWRLGLREDARADFQDSTVEEIADARDAEDGCA